MNVVWYLIAYIVPAAVIWGIFSILFWMVFGSAPFIACWIMLGYALVYAIVEMKELSLYPPGSKWQVPAQWLYNRSIMVRSLIWGTCLGPGFFTKNPYAGFWILPFFVALAQNFPTALFIGTAIGATHGFARAIGIVYNIKQMKDASSTYSLMGLFSSWILVDGLLLWWIVGFSIAYLQWIISF